MIENKHKARGAFAIFMIATHVRLNIKVYVILTPANNGGHAVLPTDVTTQGRIPRYGHIQAFIELLLVSPSGAIGSLFFPHVPTYM